ncbi:MAG: Maf family protein [Desulfonatronovibrio sp.]
MNQKKAAQNYFLDCQGPFRSQADIVLASASPRRQALLASLGICFQVVPARFKEPPAKPGQTPEEYALRMSGEKAAEIAARKPGSLIVAADTIVIHDEVIMGKPVSESHALEMLSSLQGCTHRVITAVNIISGNRKQTRSFTCETLVEMVQAGNDTLKKYIETGEPRDKAGAYAIQGTGAFLISSIQGSYTNVVGLPLAQVWTVLLEMEAVRSC